MTVTPGTFLGLLPELVAFGFTVIVLLVGVFSPASKGITAGLAALGAAATFAAAAVLFAAGFHLIFAVTYLGVSFYTTRNPKSNVFTFWYYAAIVELAIHIIHARFSMTLSFLGTHLTERLNLLTLIILGEGSSMHLNSHLRCVAD